MSDAHSEQDAPHEGPIKTPKQLAVAVVAAFVVPVIVIVMLASYITTATRPVAGSNLMTPEAVAARIQAVGRVEIRDASSAATLKTGEQVFTVQCSACHNAGVAGAPKLGDADAWAPRIKTGYEALLNSSLKGKGAMGAQGGGDFSEIEIGRAVVYMANKGGAKFDEPQAPAAAASGASAPAADAAVAAASAPAAK